MSPRSICDTVNVDDLCRVELAKKRRSSLAPPAIYCTRAPTPSDHRNDARDCASCYPMGQALVPSGLD